VPILELLMDKLGLDSGQVKAVERPKACRPADGGNAHQELVRVCREVLLMIYLKKIGFKRLHSLSRCLMASFFLQVDQHVKF
jgi:hypothetical protein